MEIVLMSELGNIKETIKDLDLEDAIERAKKISARVGQEVGVYLFLWGAVQNEFDLATAIWGSVYLAAGTHFEEQRLLARYGADYEAFCKKVPALVPWRGRL